MKRPILRGLRLLTLAAALLFPAFASGGPPTDTRKEIESAQVPANGSDGTRADVSKDGRPGKQSGYSSANEEALKAIADYRALSSRFDDDSKKLGYQPSVPPEIWRAYPVERKIAIMYAEAENAQPSSGEKMLAMLSKSLAQQYESSRQSVAIARLLNVPTEGTTLTFKPLPANSQLPAVPARYLPAIEAIAKYSGPSGPLGTPHDVIAKYFGSHLPKEVKPIHILINQPSIADAYKRAFSYLADEHIEPVMQSIVGDLVKSREAAWYERAFTPFLPPRGEGGGGGFQRPPEKTSWPRPSRTSPDVTPAPEKFEAGMREHYSQPESRMIEKMRRETKVFGGGVFSGRLDSGKLGKIRRMRFVALGRNDGDLICEFDDGRVFTFSSVLREDVALAHQVLALRPISAGKILANEGMGLVGLHGSTHLQVVLHPEFVNTDLGYCLISSDAIPLYTKIAVLNKIEKEKGMQVRKSVEAVLDRIVTSGYVLTDVAMELKTEGNEMRIVAKGSELPKAFLELWPVASANRQDQFKEDDAPKYAKEFNKVVPVICGSSYEFYRVNGFVPVFALVRKAHVDEAELEDIPPIPTSDVRTPDAIEVDRHEGTFKAISASN